MLPMSPSLLVSASLLFVFAAVSACGFYWWAIHSITPTPPAPAIQTPPASGESTWRRLRAHVDFLTALPRNFTAVARLEEIVAYIGAEFRTAGARVCHQPYQIPVRESGASRARTYKNVIARFGAAHTHGATPPPVVVVGAHYDSCGETPGADDNASGVAVLMEVARLLGAHDRELGRLGVAVELVAYFGEEPPFFAGPYMGSVQHARSLHDSGRPILGVLVLEMVGYFSDEPQSQRYPAGLALGLRSKYGNVGDYIGVVGRHDQEAFVMAVHSAMQTVSGLRVHSLAAPRSLRGVDLSDHRSYWALGDRAAMITDTAFNRNPNYHQKTDTADTLDYPRMAVVGEQVAAAVLAIAQQPAPVEEDARVDLRIPPVVRRGAHRARLLDGRA